MNKKILLALTLSLSLVSIAPVLVACNDKPSVAPNQPSDQTKVQTPEEKYNLNFQYNDSDKTAIVKGFNDYSKIDFNNKEGIDLKIPETITKDNKVYTITEIGAEAFKATEKQRYVFGHVDLSETKITKIGDRAFSWYRSEYSGQDKKNSIDRLTLPGTIKEIGESAFEYTQNIGSIDLPESIEIIKKNAFTLAGLEQIK